MEFSSGMFLLGNLLVAYAKLGFCFLKKEAIESSHLYISHNHSIARPYHFVNTNLPKKTVKRNNTSRYEDEKQLSLSN